MSPARRSRLPALTLLGVLAAPLLLAGCGEDHGPQLLPVGQTLREQPGVSAVDDFYAAPQLKIAERYEAVVHPAWYSTPAQACAVIPVFFEAATDVGVNPQIMQLSLRYGDTNKVYPYPWSFDFSPSNAREDKGAQRVEAACLQVQKLRSLPPGSSTAVEFHKSEVEVRVHIQRDLELAPTEAKAAALVGELLGIDPDAFGAAKKTGYDVRVYLETRTES